MTIARTFLVILLLVANAAQAQHWPARPVRMVVAFAPGGSTDIAVRERFAQYGLEPAGGTPQEFARLYREDYEKYARLTKELNIKLE